MRRLTGLFCLCAVAVGCAAGSYDAAETAAEASGAAAPAGAAGLRQGTEGGEPSASSGDAARIIYSADVRVVAGDFAVAEKNLEALVADVEGYFASAREDRSSGSSRFGTWTVRVPVAKFEAFLAGLDEIGFVESRNQTSEEVTAEYIDVEARIVNLQRLEERFVSLLAERTGRLEDVLKVEQELARVRGEIEQAQGRLRYLTNKTDFATVSVAIREQKDYSPPKAPSFAERVEATWAESLAALRRVGQAAVLAAVALVPWAAVGAIPVSAVAATVRLATKRKRRTREIRNGG